MARRDFKPDVVTGWQRHEMAETKKNECANALKDAKRLCKEFAFTAGMLKGSLAEGWKKQ